PALDLDPAVQAAMDRDLIEVTIPALQAIYTAKTYTAAQVTDWYLRRIATYDDVYRAVLHVDAAGAHATAAAEDTAARNGGASFTRGPLWGVPMVIKANTSVKGLVTSAGWSGFLIPGFELVAPADATVVAKLRAAGVVILGQTNMPDFAASDGNISSAYGRTGDAYNWRFSPGGSSGGTVTAVAADFAVFGTGTDTSNSIRLPSGASGLVGVLPTRGLLSINGIHPLDWLLDNTGPMARNVTDAAITLGVMAGEESKDFRTLGSPTKPQPGPYLQYLKKDALKGKRFGVPSFIMDDAALRPETRDMFMKAIERLRSEGATIVLNDAVLSGNFEALTEAIQTRLYLRDGLERFLQEFGPSQYHSTTEYARTVGSSIPLFFVGLPLRNLQTDAEAEAHFLGPQRRA